MKDTYKDFFMIIKKPMKDRPSTQTGGTRYRHYSYENAEAEAYRLANVTGDSFLILKTVARINPTQADPNQNEVS